jgi:hypothetical protein
VQLFSNYSLVLQFFWQKKFDAKAARKMLMKLTTGIESISTAKGWERCFVLT